MKRPREIVAILDFGSQYSQLIARAVREAQVYCEILPYSVSPETLQEMGVRAVIMSGGPESVYDPGAPVPAREVYRLGIPVLGICYGMQVMAYQNGGRVEPAKVREFGRTEIRQVRPSRLFGDLAPTLVGWMSHGDEVLALPRGFEVLAVTDAELIAAIANERQKLYGVQFHPEVSHTPWGVDLLKAFLYDIAGLSRSWTMANFIPVAVHDIREQVKGGRSICAVSGGVDSVTTAVLVHKAIRNRLISIFVDHGLLRADEARTVVSLFRDNFKINLYSIDASARFLKKLKGVTDPERKRIIIGREFIRVFEESAATLKDVRYLAQGTLYPDVIESQQGSRGPAHRIKSHHNVGGLPRRMKLELIEPLRYLFKDEVRQLASLLGIPPAVWKRQPFPGPGLAIRVIGEVTPERLEILRQADRIITEEIQKAGIDEELWQYFGVLPLIRSVGVMGDRRTYAYPIVIRAVTSRDGMTADWYPLSHNLLGRISRRIVNEVPGVNRVLFDITSKPPSTIEWE
ncbi:MAG: glutamine-hydrolyzing GMP synthase [bacterium JZ-2024 1]